jgi:hypothetical protein
VLRDGVGIGYKDNWGFTYPGGAQFFFGDGSARLDGRNFQLASEYRGTSS